jgi:hypothetical protein
VVRPDRWDNAAVMKVDSEARTQHDRAVDKRSEWRLELAGADLDGRSLPGCDQLRVDRLPLGASTSRHHQPIHDQQLALFTVDPTIAAPLITPSNLIDQQDRQVPAGGDRSASCCE